MKYGKTTNRHKAKFFLRMVEERADGRWVGDMVCFTEEGGIQLNSMAWITKDVVDFGLESIEASEFNEAWNRAINTLCKEL